MKNTTKYMTWGAALLGTLIALALWWYFRDRYEYANPGYWWLLLLIPVFGAFYALRQSTWQPRVKLSTLSISKLGESPKRTFRYLLFALRMGALSLLIIAAARPQSSKSWENVSTEGIDIMIALDISASMLARDFEPNRLAAAKNVAIDFIENRPNDRIGLVVYEGESFTQCPLTTDHRVLKNLFADVNSGTVAGGTAIGMGLATSVNRLKESEAPSRVVILLTDGENNQGAITPITAAEIAQQYNVRVYTIGVGTHGKALSPTAIYPDGSYKFDYVEVNIDEETLKEIASITGGSYFRATNTESLRSIYQEIDRMEKIQFNVTRHSQRSERYFWFVVAGAGILLLEFLLNRSVLQTSP